MPAIIPNIALGRAIEFGHQVNNNDPATARFTMVQLKAAEALATLKDHDTLAVILAAAGNTECDYTNYARLHVTDVELAAITPDDGADRVDLAMPEVDIADAGVAGNPADPGNNTIAVRIWCFDKLGTGVTANMIPVQVQDDGRLTSGSRLVWEAGVILSAS